MPDIPSDSTKRQIAQSSLLARLTAGVVAALLIVFFITTIGNTTTMLNKVEMVKEDQFPASVAAGHLETRLVQLRTIASQATYVNSDVGADELMRVNGQATEEIQNLIEVISSSKSVDSNDARALSDGYATLTNRMENLAGKLRDPKISAEDISQYVNTDIYPLISGLLSVDQSVLTESTHAVDRIYEAVNDVCRETIFVAWILVLAVLITLVVYLALLHRKTRREEHLTAELEQALQAAQAANMAKSTFLSSMSHDIRTPMNAIVGLTTIAKANLHDSERLESCLDRITVSSKHLLSLVSDVLDMSEIETGRMALAEDVVDLRELLGELISMVQIQARGRQLNLDVGIGTLDHELVRSDAMRIQQVVMNLASNAIKYTKPGGWVRIRLTEFPTDQPDVSTYRLVVEDNGIGMEPEFLENIFDPFERERNEATGSTEGAGLGMTITKNVVDLMGGTIDVQSEVGKGSKFTVDMPLQTIASEPARAVAAEADDTNPVHGRVLVVEDDDLNREIAIELIQSVGPEVETATDGLEALDVFQAAPTGYFDLVFMDFQMPRMGGVEATKRIRAWEDAEHRPHTPIVAMTANAFNEDRQKAMSVGMDGFISKPINMTTLRKHLRKHLG